MDSQTKILEAAITLFAQKGLHGTRMEDIGKSAQINKAMVYYYYSSKENMFQEALNMIVKRIYSRITSGVREAKTQNCSPKEMVVLFTRLHFEQFSIEKRYTQLFMDVLSYNPRLMQNAFINAFEEQEIREHELIKQSFEDGVKQGIFRDVDFMQIFISIIGMNLIYFLARPIAETLLNFDVQNESEFLKKREESIIDLLLHGIMIEN